MDIGKAFKEYRNDIVRAMTYFCRDEEAAQDGASHAFAKALANKLMLEAMPEPAMKAWLYAAARNAVVDIKRREIRLDRFTEVFEFADPRQDDPAGKAAMTSLVEKLPGCLRVPVELKYYGGMNATEIGKVMNLPSATVRSRLKTAIQKLREKI